MEVQPEWIGRNQNQINTPFILIVKPSWLSHLKNFIEINLNLKVTKPLCSMKAKKSQQIKEVRALLLTLTLQTFLTTLDYKKNTNVR